MKKPTTGCIRHSAAAMLLTLSALASPPAQAQHQTMTYEFSNDVKFYSTEIRPGQPMNR